MSYRWCLVWVCIDKAGFFCIKTVSLCLFLPLHLVSFLPSLHQGRKVSLLLCAKEGHDSLISTRKEDKKKTLTAKAGSNETIPVRPFLPCTKEGRSINGEKDLEGPSTIPSVYQWGEGPSTIPSFHQGVKGRTWLVDMCERKEAMRPFLPSTEEARSLCSFALPRALCKRALYLPSSSDLSFFLLSLSLCFFLLSLNLFIFLLSLISLSSFFHQSLYPPSSSNLSFFLFP